VHAVQVVPPVLVRVLEPASQVAQATFESAEYSPAVHTVQVVAPVLVRVSVMEPASQVAQATFESAEYSPAVHAAQVVAPVLVRVSVMEPALQVVHMVGPTAVLYLPAVQAVQVLAMAVSVQAQ
jgi:hypothetical protein